MSKIVSVGVEKDHVESITRANGINALSELIWNALDADATVVEINYTKNYLGNYEVIEVVDNGHGLQYEQAQSVFGKLGGSEKKVKSLSPKGRAYHGKEGKGRYKALALGDLVTFESTYKKNGQNKQFKITINRNELRNSIFNDPIEVSKNDHNIGFKVSITNVDNKNASHALKFENRHELEERFASYWISYPTFQININNKALDFDSLMTNTYEELVTEVISGKNYGFNIKIIEWNFSNKKKTYLCNSKGIPFRELPLGIRSSIPISIFIESVYIEKLHRDNVLDLEMDTHLLEVLKKAKNVARKYVRERLHYYSKAFINDLKKEKLYPYSNEATNTIEEAERQVFDIVALQVNEYLPSFSEQDKAGKKLTLSLIKEALESDSNNLKTILSEIMELPEEKQEELAEILEKSSLTNVIDTMKEVTNRLTFLSGLEQLIYDPLKSKNIKERKHLHKILEHETWVFGDEYALGVSDVSLKNVLKEYLKELGRSDFEEIVEEGDNEELQTIPDVCLWSMNSLGKPGHHRNLVVELKRPTVDAGFVELSQIQSYANKVSADRRFPKNKTKWAFYLITRKIKSEIEPQMQQQDRKYGHMVSTEHYDVFVLTWGDIINEAKARYQFIKEKLNLQLETNEEGLSYLRTLYKQYLPDEF